MTNQKMACAPSEDSDQPGHQADAQADLSLRWAHMPLCWFCHEVAHFDSLQVHVIELGPYKTGNFAPRNTYDHINFFDDTDHYDFPVALHVSIIRITTGTSSYEIMVLFVLHKLILQMRMRGHPVGLVVWFLVGPFFCYYTSCVWTAKALVRLRRSPIW